MTRAGSIGHGLGHVVRQNLPDFEPFEEIYRKIHQNPELSRQERETAIYPAKHLAELGFQVHEKVGGYGVVGTLRNGIGRTILLRAELDALPLLEKTGLSYASEKRAVFEDGLEYPVMHACGHDMNTVVLMATASLLTSAKDSWSGTLICLFQPSEEAGGGAAGMVADGLYDKVPLPDVVLGQHVVRNKAGTVSIRPGPVLAGSDSYHVKVFGKGGHGAVPQVAVNPINIGAHIIARLPEIITTKIAPDEFAIINVGSVHAGEAENIIPDELDMKISVRNYDLHIRDLLYREIVRIIKAETDASGSPLAPEINRVDSSPPTVNSPEIVAPIFQVFKEYFEGNAFEMDRDTASEDFSDLATPHNIPYAYWNFGSTEPGKWDDAVERDRVDQIPGEHSSYFAPAIEPTLTTGTEAFALAALTFLSQ
ncbi:MAG: hypothetical protein Q9191_006111 [Dirinaria sp. TL-2023a]